MNMTSQPGEGQSGDSLLQGRDDEFVPLSTYQGLTSKELANLVGSKRIIIWGGGHLGRVIHRVLMKGGFTNCIFCDRNSSLHDTQMSGVHVISPEAALEEAKDQRAILIIASARFQQEIRSQCLENGLEARKDFLLYVHISRPEAVIELSGDRWNVPSERQADPQRNRVISLDTYKKVLNKLIKDIPQLSHIDLAAWGEPFLNPELAEIVIYTERNVPCTVTTNLLRPEQLKNVLAAKPSQFVVSASGYGDSYDKNQRDGDWKTFGRNLQFLADLIKENGPTDTEFRLLYNLHRNNQGRDLEDMKTLCRNLNIKMVESEAYLDPYDHVLDFCQEKNLPTEAVNVKDNLAWNFPLALSLSTQDKNRPCLCQRMFPIVDWDLSVRICHLYTRPEIAPDFLKLNMEGLVALRHSNAHCRKCQAYGLHRLDIEVLRRRYPSEKLQISENQHDEERPDA